MSILTQGYLCLMDDKTIKKPIQKLTKEQKKALQQELKDAIESYLYHRTRLDKSPFSDEERLTILKDIYDSACMFTSQLILEGSYGGSGASTMVIERMGAQIDRLEQKMRDDGNGSNEKTFILKFADD